MSSGLYNEGLFREGLLRTTNLVRPGLITQFDTLEEALTRFAVNNVEAALALDFIGSEYRTANTSTTFAEAFTGNSPKLTYNPGSASSSQSTMVNSSGEIVWTPHNLLDYSEDFTQSLFVKDADVQIGTTNNDDPAGGNAATQINVSGSGRIYANATSGDYFTSVYIKPGTFSNFKFAGFFIDLGVTPPTNSDPNGSIVALPDNWFRVTVKYTGNRPLQIQAYPDNTYVSHTQSGDYQIWGAHYYRSDLGGMAPVPGAEGDFQYYVPTNGAAEYLPRVGHHVYNGSTWVNEGLLIESEQRTNLLTHSEDFTDASWGVYQATVTADSTPAPDGQTGTHLLQSSGTNDVHRIQEASGTSVTASTDYTFSIYVKAGNHNYVTIGFYGASEEHVAATFDLSSGTQATETDVGTTSGIITQTSKESVGNSWFRLSITGSTGATSALSSVCFAPAASGASYTNFGQPAWDAAGTETVYIWGAQLEAGSTPSSYIPTSGSTVTRGAQSLTVPANWYDADTPTYTGPELVTTTAVENGGWTVSGTTVTAPGTSGGTDNVVFTLSTPLEVGKVYEVAVPNDLPASGFFVDTAGGSAQFGGLGSSDTTVVLQCTGATSSLRIGRWSGSPSGTIGPISVRQVSAPQFAWPELEFIGPELVVDGSGNWVGDFDVAADLDEWTAHNNAVITHQSASGRMRVANGATGRAGAGISFSTVVGEVYVLRFDGIAGTAPDGAFAYIGGSLGSASVASIFNVDGVGLQVTFVAENTTTWVTFLPSTTASGLYVDIDNVSVREINPLSVSIQMDGRMTYVDEDSSQTVTNYHWFKDVSNYITTTVRTDSTFSGGMSFGQKKDTSTFISDASLDPYTPGILTPFNISSRHGSTFINGAADGVALTANTTPTALPDLSGTDLQIAYDFMGTIGQFRQFAGDIGDTGLVTATNPSTEPTLSLTFDGTEGSYYNLSWSE